MSEANLEQAIAPAARPGGAKETDLVTTRNLLTKNPHALGFVSPKGAIAFFNYIMSVATPSMVSFELPVSGDCPPVEVAVRAREATIKIDTILPDATINVLGQYIEKVKATMAVGL